MKFSLKLCLAVVALAFFGAAIGMFGLSFIDSQAVALVKSEFDTLINGFDLAFKNANWIEDGKNLGTLFAFILVALGAAAALCSVALAFANGGKKSKKANKTAKLVCAASIFVVCAVVPAILLFLTLQTVGLSADSTYKGLVGANFRLGVGAILAAIFSLLGGCSLAVAELK